MPDESEPRKFVVVILVDGNLKNYEIHAYHQEDAIDDALAQALFDGTKVEVRGAYISNSMPDIDDYDC